MLRELFSDGKHLSWLRVTGFIIAVTCCFCIIWATVTRFDAPLIPCTGILGALLTTKVFQNKTELELSKNDQARADQPQGQ